MSASAARPVSPSVLSREWGRQWELVGTRCDGCGEVAFGDLDPWCPRCGSEAVERVPLPRQGHLWSYTVVRHRPPGECHLPEPFVPFGLGLVELPVGVRVLAPLAVATDRLAIGLPLTLDVHVLHVDDEGAEVLAFRFVEVVGG